MGSLKFSDAPYPSIMLKYLFDMQQSNKMCDLTIIVENEEIHVHKLVLAAVSPYFSTLSNNNFKENIENKITFSDISKTGLEAIIRFIYTGKIEINNLNVYDIISTAHRLQFSLLKLPISHYLISTLNSKNCLEALAHAKLFDYEELFAETLKFIEKNYQFVVTKDIFLQAPIDVVKHVLCQREMSLHSILNVLGKWMKHNDCKTEFEFPMIVTKEMLDAKCNRIKKNNPEFSELLTTISEFLKKYYSHEDNLKDNIRVQENQIILSIGGSSNGTIYSTLESYDKIWTHCLPSFYDNISVIPTMATPRMCFAVAQPIHCPHVVYVVGGLGTGSTGFALNSCERYDALSNQWTQIKEFPKKVKSHAATWAEGKMIVTGGVTDEGEVLTDVWEYYEKDNRWAAGTPMLEPRMSHGTVNVMGTVYVLGGQGATRGKMLSSVERYNSDLRTWNYVTDMPEPKYEFGCVAVNEYIYVIGGASRHYVYDCVHKYNTLTDKWEECHKKNEQKSAFGCAVRNGKIYCVGGSDIVHGPLSSVEIYNPLTNRWHYSNDKLVTPRSYTCAMTVRVDRIDVEEC